jgi:aldehyde dehydrogenase (NAD+)
MKGVNEMISLHNYIAGRKAPPQNGQWIECDNPANGTVWGRVPRSDVNDVRAAVDAAAAAFREGPWATMLPGERTLALLKVADVIEAHAEELARLETRDNGKTLKEMLIQVKQIPSYFRYFAGLADKIEGELPSPDRPDHMVYIRHEPFGVIAIVTPWNSPLTLLTWKLAPALAAGNTAVVKPSEFTSASTLYFAEILTEKAGLPLGVINVITGYGQEAGDLLIRDEGVAKVTFTGGVASGRAVYKSAADGIKPVGLELGGKSPHIIFEDADLELAARGAVSGIFGSCGQSCVAGSRLLLQRSIHDAVLKRIVELTAKIRLGDPLDPETDIGPVANRPQYDRILGYIEKGKAEEATIAIGGGADIEANGGKGLFIQPTIFTGVDNAMTIAREEIFGPVLCVIPFDTEEDAIRIANDTAFRLGSGLWTRDIGRVHRVAAKIQAGSVWVNNYKIASYVSPFGGFKTSGIGRENGRAAIEEFLQKKSVWINLSDRIPYPFPL